MKSSKAEYAADYARNKALGSSSGNCAKYLANALEYGGGFSFSRQSSAYMYHENGILEGLGYTLISKPSTPKKGFIYVEDRTSTHPHGHIAIYEGSNWVSDFVQKTDHVHFSDSGTNYYYGYSDSGNEGNEDCFIY